MTRTPAEGGFRMPAGWRLHDDGREGAIDVRLFPTNAVWARDNGPIFVVNDQGELAATDWNFNGRASGSPTTRRPRCRWRSARCSPCRCSRPRSRWRGGGVDVNGAGTRLDTRSSIAKPSPNPNWGMGDIEDVLEQYLGLEHVICPSAERGMGDTDFHIDGAARFVDQTAVLHSWTDDTSHPRHANFGNHRDELRQVIITSGERLTLVPLPTHGRQTKETMNG